jgi:succinoglycan biosynthesis transport protein ExoP
MTDDPRLPYDNVTPHPTPPPYAPPGAWYAAAPPDWGEDSEPEIDVMEYARLIWAKKWLVVGVLVATVVLATAWSLTRTKMYRAASKITLQPAPQLSQNQFDLMMSWWQMDRFIADQIQVLKTRQMAQRLVDRLGLDTSAEFQGRDPVGAVLGMVSAEPVKDSFVIEISMVSPDPERASEWLNLYVQEFMKANIEAALDRSRQVYQVIQDRLAPLQDQVAQAEANLMQYREREDAVLFADEDQNVISEQLSTLTTEYAQAKADRIRLETKINALRNLGKSRSSYTTFAEVLQDPTVQSLVQERNDDEVTLNEKLRELKEGHPEIKDLRASIATIESRIADQVEAIKASLETDFQIVSRREQSLYDNIQGLRNDSIEVSKQRLEADRLEREYQQTKAFLEDMLARSNEANISSTQTVNNIRVIEQAVRPKAPFTPNVPRTVALATFLGLFLGVGLVLGLDYLDQTIRTPDHMEHYVGLETLSAMPKFTEENARALRESFQALRTAMMLASRGEGCHIAMVTSAVPEEGKTTVAYNLAKVLANGGSRVLLVDADLRKPRIHRIIKAKNVRGLTSVVLGERKAAEVIHTQPDIPNLDIITSGPLPPNPPELFGKRTFKGLLDEAREHYEWVVIDTPPVASVTDPVMCAQVCDMVLLIAQYGSTRRKIIREAVKTIGRTGTQIAGAVLNQIDIQRDHYYYSGYYSYYRYGYYGDDSRDRLKSKKQAG